MYRAPVRPQRSPGAPRPSGRFPSPASCWGFPGARSPHGASRPRAGSPRGSALHSPPYSPAASWGHGDGSPAATGGGARGSGGRMWGRGGGFRRHQHFSPSAHLKQSGSSDAPVEKYFSPAMLQDPWSSLQPVAVSDR